MLPTKELGGRKVISQMEKLEIIMAWKRGDSVRKIARESGLSRNTVANSRQLSPTPAKDAPPVLLLVLYPFGIHEKRKENWSTFLGTAEHDAGEIALGAQIYRKFKRKSAMPTTYVPSGFRVSGIGSPTTKTFLASPRTKSNGRSSFFNTSGSATLWAICIYMAS